MCHTAAEVIAHTQVQVPHESAAMPWAPHVPGPPLLVLPSYVTQINFALSILRKKTYSSFTMSRRTQFGSLFFFFLEIVSPTLLFPCFMDDVLFFQLSSAAMPGLSSDFPILSPLLPLHLDFFVAWSIGMN